ncbi:hypothetical protein LCGC14_2199830, partial [marine sediment metagenome]
DVLLLSITDARHPLEAFREEVPKAGEEEFDLEPEALPENFLQSIPKDLRKKIVEGSKGTDRSANDYHVARRLLQKGYSAGQILTVFLTTTYVVSEKTTEKGIGYATRTIQSALKEERKPGAGSLAALAEGLHWIDGKRRKEVDPDYAFTGPVIKWLRDHGMEFLRDVQAGNGYVFWQGRVISGDKDDRELKDFIYEQAGLSETSWDSRKLRESISHEARVHGKDVILHTWITFDTITCKGYILPNPRSGSVIMLTAGKIELGSNGADGYLLRPSMLSLAVSPDFSADKAKGLATLVNVLTSKFACSDEARQLLTCYMIGILLREFAISDLIPILHVTGASGGGKSWALKLITAWLYGRPLLLRSTQAASYAISNSDPLLALDDYETLDQEWQGRLLTGATGLVRTKMSSVAQNTAVLQEGTTTFALTSINPLPTDTLRRRAAVVEVDSDKYATKDFNSTTTIGEIEQTRNETWSAVLKLIAEDILPEMIEGSARKNIVQVQEMIQVVENRSLAAYLTIMWLIGKAINKYVPGFMPTDLEETTRIWAQILRLQSHAEFVERDPLILMVDMTYEEMFKVGGDYSLLRGIDVKPVLDAGRLLGFMGTGSELHATFASVCRTHGLRYDMT